MTRARAHARPGRIIPSGRVMTSAMVKVVAVGGLVAAAGVAVGAEVVPARVAAQPAGTPGAHPVHIVDTFGQSGPATTGTLQPHIQSVLLPAALADRSAASDRAARSTARASLTAPEVPAPVQQAFGASQVTAVAKPKPKPKPRPKPAAEASGSHGSRGGSHAATSGSSAGSPLDTSAFASQGRAKGLGPHAVQVYSAVRSTFGITNIGGYRAGDPGDHGAGNAVDVMITGASQGDAVAAYVMGHASALHVKYVIWQQRIWFPGASGWRGMADRGSPTANHFDHVHISVR